MYRISGIIYSFWIVGILPTWTPPERMLFAKEAIVRAAVASIEGTRLPGR